MKRAVLVSLGPVAPGDALLAGVERLRADGASVWLLTRTPPVPALAAELNGGLVRLGSLTRTPLAVGKLRLDPNRLPGAVRLLLRRETRRLVRDAELIAAVDAAALPAVWLAARLNRRATATHGLPT
jgi:hypothetical protein